MKGAEIQGGITAAVPGAGPRTPNADCLGSKQVVHVGGIPTGLSTVDDLLGGGIPPGVVVDVFGGYGTGKTQLLLQAAAAFAGAGRHVLYVDTTGKFRPERIVEMAGSDKSILDRIMLIRIQNVAAQIAAAADPRNSEFDLIMVDSITDLFSYEYSRYGSLWERNRIFLDYMRKLARLAVCGRASVLISNMVRTVGDREVENMAAEIDLFTHVKVHLTKEDDINTKKRFRGHVSCAFSSAARDVARGLSGHGQEFTYEISASGIRPVESGLENLT